MFRFVLCLLFFALACLASVVDVSACDRCGLFGRRCRFAVQSHHIVDHHQGYGYGNGGTQTFNFINSFPTAPLLAAQGQTVYGYNLSAQAYSVDPALIFDTAGRLADNANSLAKQGVVGYTELALRQLSAQQALTAEALEVAKVEAQGRAAANALAAARPASSVVTPQIYSFRATVSNGQLSVEEIPADQAQHAASDPTSLTTLDHAKALLNSRCGSCHSGASAKASPFLDRELTEAVLFKILARVTAESPDKLMPPKGPRLKLDELAPLFAAKESLRKSTVSNDIASPASHANREKIGGKNGERYFEEYDPVQKKWVPSDGKINGVIPLPPPGY